MMKRKASLRCACPAGINGFSLVEVVLAVGIVAFGLVAIFSLLPVGLVSVREGKAQEEATDFLAFAAMELRAAHASGTLSPLLRLDSAASTNQALTLNLSGGIVETNDPSARYRLVSTPLTNSAFAGKAFHLKITWPPQAASPTGTAESLLALPERRTEGTP